MPTSGARRPRTSTAALSARPSTWASPSRSPHPTIGIGPYTVDFLWAKERLVVEADGYAGHRGRVAFELDRERDLYLKLRGYEVLRLSWRQLHEDPARVAAAIRALLKRAGDRG